MKASPHHVSVRLDDALLARIDALRTKLSTPWHEATRSDVLRALVKLGLDAAEADQSLLEKLPGDAE